MATLKIDLGLKSFEVCDTDGNTPRSQSCFNPSTRAAAPVEWTPKGARIGALRKENTINGGRSGQL